MWIRDENQFPWFCCGLKTDLRTSIKQLQLIKKLSKRASNIMPLFDRYFLYLKFTRNLPLWRDIFARNMLLDLLFSI